MSQSSLSSLANNHGFSLIELMVALVIASFVMLGVFQLFISSRQTFATHEAASRIYDNARVALQLMAKDISKTGYRGCVQSQVKGSGINNGEPALVSLLKYAGTGTPPRAHQPYDDLANSLEAYSAAGEDGISDEFTLRYQDGANSVRVLRTLGQTGDIIIAASDPHYSQLYQAVMGSRGGPLLATLSDCQRSIAFVISTITHHGNGEATVAKAINTAPAEPAKISYLINTATDWQSESIGSEAGSLASLQRLWIVTYRVNASPGGGFGLYREVNGAPAQEIAQGVKSLTIEYGINDQANGGVSRYTRMPTALETGHASTMRITLVLTDVVDSNLEKTFVRTVKLRNRGLTDWHGKGQ